MPPFVGMIFSKAGAYVLVALVIAGLAGTVYIERLKIRALKAERDAAYVVNKTQADTINKITADKNDFEAKATDLNQKLAAAKAKSEIRTQAIIKEVKDHASDIDHQLLSPAARNALIELRDRHAD